MSPSLWSCTLASEETGRGGIRFARDDDREGLFSVPVLGILAAITTDDCGGGAIHESLRRLWGNNTSTTSTNNLL